MLIISYKSNYTNTCRGCTMESYGSDFQIHHFVTIEEAIEHCSQLDATTHLNQLFGANAWEHYIVEQDFETKMQVAQCCDKDEWVSQGASSCFCTFDWEIQEKIAKRTDEIYSALIADKKRKEEEKREKERKIQLARDIANAKALLEKNPNT